MDPYKIDRSFAFALSLEDFDEKGDNNNFKGETFTRGPKGNTEDYIQPTSDWFRIGLKVDTKYIDD